MTQTCPVCGSPHDTWGGVAVHLWKKSDAEHEHIKSKDGGLEWLATEGHLGGDMSSDTPETSPVDTDESDTATPAATDGGAKTLEVPNDSKNEKDAESADTATREAACPECDRGPDAAATYESQRYLRKAGDRLPENTANAIEQHDYVCTNCWKGFDE